MRSLFVIIALSLCSVPAWGSELLSQVHWLGHGSVRIDTPVVIYIDPWDIERGRAADLILISHPHSDHCSPKDVAKIQHTNTKIITTRDCAKKLSGFVKILKPGESFEFKNIKITAIPAYNLKKPFHKKEQDWLGFVVTVGGETIYYSGDTDLIPEMKDLKPDIALLPIGGKFSMDLREAAEACTLIQPKLVIPILWGKTRGSHQEALKFKEISPVPTKILKQER